MCMGKAKKPKTPSSPLNQFDKLYPQENVPRSPDPTDPLGKAQILSRVRSHPRP